MVKKNDNDTIGKRIQMLRKNNNETQKKLAQVINTSSDNLSKIEQGRTGLTLENLLKIAEHYNVSLDYICKGEDNSTFLQLLTSLISIKLTTYSPPSGSLQKLLCPTLCLNSRLLRYLLELNEAQNFSRMSDKVKADWIKEIKNDFFKDFKNIKNFDTIDLIPVEPDILSPDNSKINWEKSDLLREVERSIESLKKH